MASRNPGRVAGILYLLLLVAAVRLVYIPMTLFVAGDAAATARNLATHEMLFRIGMVTDLFAGAVAPFVVLALYRLFKGVDQPLAVLMVFLGGPMVSAIYFSNVANDAAALLLARGADFLGVIDPVHRDALAMLFLRLHHFGVLANEVFWGLWLFPLGILIHRSGFMPRFIGVWLILNGIAYCLLSLTGFLAPRFENTMDLIALPAQLAELVTIAWLIIKNPRPPEMVVV